MFIEADKNSVWEPESADKHVGAPTTEFFNDENNSLYSNNNSNFASLVLCVMMK